MADELLIWQPRGGCIFIYRDRAVYRTERASPGVLFLQLEMNRLMAVPPRQTDLRRVSTAT
jgi:hypothetical protein